MRNIVLVLIAIGLAVASTQQELFKSFLEKYEKTYATQQEYQKRFTIFQDNLKIIKELNDKKTHATFGITQFADLSPAEFKSKMLSPFSMDKIDPNWPVAPLISDEEISFMAESWDWRDHNAVTPVKNQADCGSCWSFSATGNMEGQWALAGHTLVGLSEQNLVDCDHHCMMYQNVSACDDGCNGGLMPNAFMYTIANGGIDTEASYPYLGEDGTCNFNPKNIGAKMTSWTMLSSNETQMAAYLYKNGPISIAVEADSWQYYIEGVFEDPWCGTELDHGVLIVGYGTETDMFGFTIDYWIVKNSWGTTFGEQGYIFLERNVGECGDNLYPCSAIA